MYRAADLIGDLTAVSEPVPDPIKRRDHVVGVDPHAAAAKGLGPPGVGADDGQCCDLLRVERQDRVRVLQQHDRLGRRLAGQEAMLWLVHRTLGLFVGMLERASSGNGTQQAARFVVEQFFADLSCIECLQYLRVQEARGTGHLQIEAAGGGAGAVGAAPIGHDDALEPPLAFQDIEQQVFVLTAVDAVDFVVGRHHGPRLAIPYGHPEGGQVDLAQGPLGYLRADRLPLEFGIVADEVLDARTHPPALHPLDIGGGHSCGETWVLRIGLEAAACQRRAVDVHGGGQEDMGAFCLGLFSQGLTHTVHQLGVPRGCQCAPCRKAG
jgi:hypothetical protein